MASLANPTSTTSTTSSGEKKEGKQGTAVFFFGRCQPIHQLHLKIINDVTTSIDGANAYIFFSQSEGDATNPIGYLEKIVLLNEMYTEVYGDSSQYKTSIDDYPPKNPFQALKLLLNKYNKVIYFYGMDRQPMVSGMLKFFDKNKAENNWGEFDPHPMERIDTAENCVSGTKCRLIAVKIYSELYKRGIDGYGTIQNQIEGAFQGDTTTKKGEILFKTIHNIANFWNEPEWSNDDVVKGMMDEITKSKEDMKKKILETHWVDLLKEMMHLLFINYNGNWSIGGRKKRTKRKRKKRRNKMNSPNHCCAGPGCPEWKHCINVLGDGKWKPKSKKTLKIMKKCGKRYTSLGKKYKKCMKKERKKLRRKTRKKTRRKTKRKTKRKSRKK